MDFNKLLKDLRESMMKDEYDQQLIVKKCLENSKKFKKIENKIYKNRKLRI